MKLYFIFNPNAGKGLLKSSLCSILEILTLKYEVTVYPTMARGDAILAAASTCGSGEYDILVCSGGDGTLNEVIQGVMNADKKLPIGFIPTGTANDFARSLGISKNQTEAAGQIIDGTPFLCDIGAFNDIYFTYISAFGAFTNVAYETSQDTKNRFGHAAYILECVKNVTSLKSYKMKIEYDDGTIEGEFAYGMITNTSSIGKFLTHDGVILNDGLFEVTLISMPANIIELNTIVQSLLNLKDDIDNTNVTSFRTKNIVITSDEKVKWTVDGEFGGEFKEVVITNKKMAIEIIR